MHSSQKGNEWHFRHEGPHWRGRRLGLVHTARGHQGNVSDVVEGNSLLHGQEMTPLVMRATRRAISVPDARQDVTWRVAMRPGEAQSADKQNNADALIEQLEKPQGQHPSQMEHPFR